MGRRNYLRLLVLFTILLLLSFSAMFVYRVATTPPWLIEDLGRAHDTLYHVDLVVGSDDVVHAAYLGIGPSGSWSLMYAEKSEAGWTTEEVVVVGRAARGVSMAVDSEGVTHICTGSPGYPGFIYAHNEEGQWAVVTLPTDYYLSSEVAVDSDDGVHIAYSGGDYPGVDLAAYHLVYDGGSWRSTQVQGPEDGIFPTVYSLAVGADGSAHALIDNLDDDYLPYSLEYVSNSSGEWSSETLCVAEDYLGYPSMAIDGDGTAHVSYIGRLPGPEFRLMYSTNDGGAWSEADVAYAGNAIPGATSLAVDAQGSVHIAYFTNHYISGVQFANHSLRCASNEAGTWDVRIVDDESEGSVYMESLAVALDSRGYTHIGHTRVDVYKFASYATDEPDPDSLNDSITGALLFTGMVGALAAAVILVLFVSVWVRHREKRDRLPPSSGWKD